MHGISNAGFAAGLPATTVLKLSGNRPVLAARNEAAEEVLIAAVTHPPRIGEARPVAALMPQVLALYGVSQEQTASDCSIDLLA